uniref:SLC12A transporter C-terminal domain-containing protein n=2 Tax=Tetranychus urticae TaxID=32264 RepID=T1KKM7_TETUR
MMDLSKEEDKEGSSKNMYLYGEEPNERPAVSTILSKLANYNYLPLTTKEGDPNGTPKGGGGGGGGAQLGTIAGVYLPCIQNIFGVILFIRMVWIVGTAGVPAAFLIVFICCSVTFCTSISLSAIATNGIVPAGGSYFMISRALGPEFGGAVGVLFFLATGVAGAMYIAGAIEIILKYITPELALFGDLNEQSVLYHNIRFYGTMILIVSVIIVFIGVKFVSKVAPFALAVCLLSIFSIYFGVFINYNGTPDTFCMVGSRIMSNTGYKNCNKNSSDPDSIWHVFCVFHNQSVTEPDQVKVGPGLYNRRLDIRLQHRSEIDGTMIEPHWDCDPYFKNHEVKLARSVPGIASGVIKENLALRFREKGDVVTMDPDARYPPELPPYSNIFVDLTTSFTFFVAVYFPSCTGILAGSNRSGDLADGQKSIPVGTIAAQLTTSFVYLSSVVLFGACFNNLFIRDKFGDCAGGQLAVTLVAWPYPKLIVFGALFSTLGAALQSLTSAPRLIQAIANDGIIPFLNRFAVMDSRGEPVRALMLTTVIAWAALLIGNLDFIAPILTMFFLMCYMFVNLACTLQSLLKTPNWRPRFKYYHWSLSMTGVFLCLFVMFISSWYYALSAIIIAGCVYKYIEYRGAEKEWGDGFRGLALSAARYSLLRLEDAPPHTKNWRPQIMVLLKLSGGDELIIKKRNLLTFVAQLKAGKGLTLVCTCIDGNTNSIEAQARASAAKQTIVKAMNEEKVKGFVNVLITNNVADGLSYYIQSAGLGGLKHNTVLLGWPHGWRQSMNSSKVDVFLQTIRNVTASKNALLIPKGVDQWPETTSPGLTGFIDVWWIVHDGGMLMLLPFLLKQNKVWKNCKLRVFTVAQMQDNSIQMKKDLKAWLYAIRIEASVEVIEFNDTDISQYTYERTLRMEQRTEMLRQMARAAAEANSGSSSNVTGGTVAKAVRFATRRKSSTTSNPTTSDPSSPPSTTTTFGPTATVVDIIPSQPVFTVSQATPPGSPERKHKNILDNVPNQDENAPPPLETNKLLNLKPDENNVRRMNTAVKLNEAIVDKSHSAKLIFINLPGLPRDIAHGRGSTESAHHYMEFLEALTEGLDRVVLVRGGGREVITIYS